MILAPTLTLNTLARGYDADATAFAAASGATDVAALSAFVKGVKELGLWSNMVCWPLRSSQNAGTGTTAYSLGGLGTFNGTLVNGPSWGADGVTADNINEEITLPDEASIYNARAGMFVFSTTATANQALLEIQTGTGSFYPVFNYAGANNDGYAGPRFLITRGGSLSINSSASRTTNITTFQSCSFSATDTTDSVFQNGSLSVSGQRSGLSAINPSGARSVRAMFFRSASTVGSFGSLFSQSLTADQHASLHALYSTTLGQGLTGL
jgi:hypothetical protein